MIVKSAIGFFFFFFTSANPIADFNCHIIKLFGSRITVYHSSTYY
jgi:hypothetical protein